MTEFITARRSKNRLSNITHIILNLLLAFGSVFVTILTTSPILGLILVLLSKWRIFAVRRRYFLTNLKANLVDIIVGISIVLLAYFPYFYTGENSLPAAVILGIFYSIWLIFIKPLSSSRAIEIQALIAVFLGTSAATLFTDELNSALLVLIEFFIGYACSRHVIVRSDENDFLLTTLTGGLLFAEISLLASAWRINYAFPAAGIYIPALAIILTIFSYVYNYIRRLILEKGHDVRFKDIAAPAVFGFLTIAIIVIWFSNPSFNF